MREDVVNFFILFYNLMVTMKEGRFELQISLWKI